MSARCTAEYSFPGVTTGITRCALRQRTGKTIEEVAWANPGNSDTSTANQTYTFSSKGVAPILTDTYSVEFLFEPTLGGSAQGQQVQLTTPFTHVLPMVTGISPNMGSTTGGTVVTVTGVGFVPGTTGTTFKFGSVLGTGVHCTSTTQCTVTSPAHAAGKVDVKATVSKVASQKNSPADQFTYS